MIVIEIVHIDIGKICATDGIIIREIFHLDDGNRSRILRFKPGAKRITHVNYCYILQEYFQLITMILCSNGVII